jgi:uncharacterized protein DUF6002
MVSSLIPQRATAAHFFDRYETELRAALAATATEYEPTGDFSPGFDLPPTTERLREYFSVVDLCFSDLGTRGNSQLVLLDLMRNPGTRTVKTLASLVIVARAIEHIRRTGERIMILTPSSANKATALRDAVLRAHTTGLATPRELQIVSVVPGCARAKLWSSELSEDPALAAGNPLCVYEGGEPGAVKTLARQAATDLSARLRRQHGVNLWHTLDLANYRCADALRAVVEQAVRPVRAGVSRVHAHSVSSAFGLLGHHAGTELFPGHASPPGYFLVQHLSTPDMVLSLYGTTLPEYRFDAATGLHRQDADAHFPATTFDPRENLESTFYTHAPATSPAMNEIIARQGGGGIVVSLHECLGRYAEIRALLARAQVRLPADPRTLREWSLVMAMTGVLNAIERNLLRADEIVVHGSGSYSDADYAPVPERRLTRVGDVAGLSRVILGAAAAVPAAGAVRVEAA